MFVCLFVYVVSKLNRKSRKPNYIRIIIVHIQNFGIKIGISIIYRMIFEVDVIGVIVYVGQLVL